MDHPRVVGIVQARTGSTRLPAKVLRSLQGKPMLQHELERLLRARRIDTLMLATTDKSEDDVVCEIAGQAGIECFRGSERDVLDRYYQAAVRAKADVVVRITGDCPLQDPVVVDAVVERFMAHGIDYTQTPKNYPEGLDTEVFSFSALATAWEEARLPSEREHVTLFIRNHPERFKLDEQWSVGGVEHSDYHWSVDTERDFLFVEAVFKHLATTPHFSMQDVIALLEAHPELRDINKGGTGFEGLERSLREDEEWKRTHS